MCRKPFLRLAVVLVLGLILAGPVRAAGPKTPSMKKVPRVFVVAWEWLQDLWAGGDHGCNIDPNGKPRCAPVTAEGDLGCNIDPNGKPRCAP